MDVLQLQAQVCGCVDFEMSSSYLHALTAHDEPRQVEKASSTECDVGEFNGLSICFFCLYTIADGGDVYKDKNHSHVHFQDGTRKGNPRYKGTCAHIFF